MSVSTLVRVGAWSLLLAGAGHLLTIADAFGGAVFSPVDETVRSAMRSSPLVFSSLLGANAPIWETYLGFSFSHGLGLVFFGVVHLQLLRRAPDFHFEHPWLLSLSIACSASWLVLAVFFWFYAPIMVAALALGCFVLARARVAGNSPPN